MLLPTVAGPEPSTPLGPFVDSAIAWTTWITLMGYVGFSALALVVAGPAARRIGSATLASVTARLARVAVPLGVLAVPAVLTDLAHESGGYDYSAAWNLLYDGTSGGLLPGLEVTLSLVGAAAVAPLMWRPVAVSRARNWLLGTGLTAGVVSLGTTKFPTDLSDGWVRTTFDTAIWMLHLLGGAIWIGGLAGLLLIALPGGLSVDARGAF